jgi:hypothetical protein
MTARLPEVRTFPKNKIKNKRERALIKKERNSGNYGDNSDFLSCCLLLPSAAFCCLLLPSAT